MLINCTIKGVIQTTPFQYTRQGALALLFTVCGSQDLNTFLAAAGVFPCLSKADKNICLENSDACVEAEGVGRGESLLPSMGLLNRPKVAGSSGDWVDSPAVTIPSGAELDLAVMDLLLSTGHVH